MKKTRQSFPAYPGAADENYIRERQLNILTSVVSGAGLMIAMLFLLTL